MVGTDEAGGAGVIENVMSRMLAVFDFLIDTKDI